MDKSEFYREVAHLTGKDLERAENDLLPVGQEAIDRESVKRRIETVILQMLSTDFEKLCNLMYRLDVSEARFHRALSENPPDEAASVIADLVIEREIQKVKTRELYRKNKL